MELHGSSDDPPPAEQVPGDFEISAAERLADAIQTSDEASGQSLGTIAAAATRAAYMDPSWTGDAETLHFNGPVFGDKQPDDPALKYILQVKQEGTEKLDRGQMGDWSAFPDKVWSVRQAPSAEDRSRRVPTLFIEDKMAVPRSETQRLLDEVHVKMFAARSVQTMTACCSATGGHTKRRISTASTVRAARAEAGEVPRC